MERAYNVRVMGRLDRVVNGKKAGRFASAKKSLKKDNRRYVRSCVRWDRIGKLACFIGWVVCAIGIYCNSRPEYNHKTDTVKIEEQDPPSTQLTKEQGFTSADMPVYIDYFDQYFGSQAGNARKVAKCESGMIATRVSKTNDYGMMQINYPTWGKFFNVSKDQLLDEETNIRLAKAIYDRSNSWSAWYMSKKCHKLVK